MCLKRRKTLINTETMLSKLASELSSIREQCDDADQKKVELDQQIICTRQETKNQNNYAIYYKDKTKAEEVV